MSVKIVQGRVLSSRPIATEWDEETCLCQGQVPTAKRIDVQEHIFDEKRKKHRWKSMVRYHQDCPVHGCNRQET